MTESKVSPVSAFDIQTDVKRALAEDVGTGDITAQLIDESTTYSVRVITREDAVLCGREWADETFKQIDQHVTLDWSYADADLMSANSIIFTATGTARSILTAERTALNFLQFLSGVATESFRYSQLVKDLHTVILDTRKTIPGYRRAQKYAVACGGCENHRMGLYDAFLIKENHIAASGSIASAVASAKALAPAKPVEIEVESIEQFRLALDAEADIIMLDDMSLQDMRAAAQEAAGRCKLEASGNMTAQRIPEVAATGVDYISIGSLTKHIRAVDLSMRYCD